MHLSTVLKLVLALWGMTFVLAVGVLVIATKRPSGPDEKKTPYAVARTVAARERAAKDDAGHNVQTVVTTTQQTSRQHMASDLEEG